MYNSLTKFGRPLRLELSASPRLAALGGLVHVLAAGTCLQARLPLSLTGLLLAAIGMHYWVFLRRHVGVIPAAALDGIAWDAHRGWRVRVAGGGWRPARLLTPFFVSLSLVVVRFRTSHRKLHTAVVFADRLPADAFRRLRVRLLQTVPAPTD